jgi:hypothetical protein
MWRSPRPKGQGLLEFALILPALLMIVLSIIEGALVFQSYLAVQHAAREAARYAVTYMPPITYSERQGDILLEGGDPGPPAYRGETENQWHARRVGLIKQRALDQAMGIRILQPTLDESHFLANYMQPGFFGVRVQGFPSANAEPEFDHPSLQGLPVRIVVYYRWEALDPLIRAIVPQGVLLNGEATMINEGIQVGLGAVAPPTFPPPATLPPPTGTPASGPATATFTPVPGATSTAEPPSTPTPTATPGYPYIILAPEKSQWLEEGLPGGVVELHNHPDGSYAISWTDNCGRTTGLGLTVEVRSGSGSASLSDSGFVRGGGRFLSETCGALQEDTVYECTLTSSQASVTVPVYVPVKPPDLVVERVTLPPNPAPGVPAMISVVVSNVGTGVVSGTFDVDIYVDPSHTPILQGQPGLGTAGGSSPKQWYANNIDPGASVTLNYVVVFPSSGDYELWAQADTSDEIDESDDENNVSGPFEISLLCSQACDNFDAGALEGKWTLTPLGTRQGAASARVTQEGELRIEGTGYDIWRDTDGKSFLLNQGAYSGDFDMRVKVMDYPRRASPRRDDEPRAGLMVRESGATGERYVAIAIVERSGVPYLQVLVRSSDDTSPQSACGNSPVPANLFDGQEGNGEGVWLRIAREGQQFTMYSSTDGESWFTDRCMQPTFSDFADPVLPGIWMAPNDSQETRFGDYDEFRLCPAGGSQEQPVRWRPPLLRECGNVLTNPDFEPFGLLAPWVTGQEPAAVVADSAYSCDRDGRPAHGFSMLFKCDQIQTWPYEPYHPWAYQDFVVPGFISSTQPVTVEMEASFYYVVPPVSAGRTEGRAEDTLQLVVQDGGGANLIAPVVVTNGAIAERARFLSFSRDLAPLFPLQDYIGQSLRLRLEAPNPTNEGDSWFYVDQVRLEMCTTVQPPAPEPGKAYRLGGRVQVVLAGQPVDIEGIDVWAIQLPDGSTPLDQLDFQATYSIQDSTYNFYNLNPGTYRIYAEVWISGNMYSAVMTTEIHEGDVITNVNMNLL